MNMIFRCLVELETEEMVSKCSYSTCMENRRLAVRNEVAFDCKHLQSVSDSLRAKTVER